MTKSKVADMLKDTAIKLAIGDPLGPEDKDIFKCLNRSCGYEAPYKDVKKQFGAECPKCHKQMYNTEPDPNDIKLSFSIKNLLKGKALTQVIKNLASKIKMVPSEADINNAIFQAEKLIGDKKAFDVEADWKTNLLTPLIAMLLLAGIPKSSMAEEVSKVVQNPATTSQVIQASHLIFYSSMTLMGQTIESIRVDNVKTGEVVEGKNFKDDSSGSQKYLKDLQKKYPGSKIVRE